MQYPTFDRGPAEEALISMERDQPIAEARVVWKGTGATFSVDAAAELIDRLKRISKSIRR